VKKQNHILKSLLVIAWLLLSINLQAELSKTVHVATAGTLSSLITEDEKFQITDLTLTGDLNGSDILFLKAMAGTLREEEAPVPEVYQYLISQVQTLSVVAKPITRRCMGVIQQRTRLEIICFILVSC